MSDKFDWGQYDQASQTDNDSNFDWNQYDVHAPQYSPLESALRGLGQGATFGASDEAMGGIQALKDIATQPDKKMSDLQNLYVQYRDAQRQKNKDAEAQNPKSYTAGDIAGTVGSSLLLPEVGLESGLAKAAVTGGLIGGLQGVGRSNATNVQDVTKDAALGAAGGAAAGPLTELGIDAAGKAIQGAGTAIGAAGKAVLPESVSDYMSSIPGKLENAANNQSMFAMGMPKTAAKKLGTKRAEALGEQAMDAGIVKPGISQSTDDMLERAQNLQNKAGQGIGQLLQKADQAGADVDGNEFIEDFMKSDNGKDLTDPLNQDLLPEFEQLKQSLDRITPNKDPDIVGQDQALNNSALEQLRNIRNMVGEKAGFDKKFGESPTREEMFNRDLYSSLNDYIDKKAVQTLGDDAPQYASLAKDYRLGKLASKYLGDKQINEIYNKPGLTGNIYDQTVGRVVNPENKAAAYSKISDILRNDSDKLGKFEPIFKDAAGRGDSAIAARHFLLYQQDPEYRKLINGIGNSEEPNK